MIFYKDENGELHAIESADFVHLLPGACVEITEAEANALQNPALLAADYAATRFAALTTACRAHITGGVVSRALGADHTYPTNNTAEHPDQQNLNGLITSSLLNDADPAWERLFWCADVSGAWDRRPHNHAQIRDVGMAVEAHVVNAQNKLKTLNDQLQAIVANAALTDDEKRTAIDAVNW
jgi:hypothetical protein